MSHRLWVCKNRLPHSRSSLTNSSFSSPLHFTSDCPSLLLYSRLLRTYQNMSDLVNSNSLEDGGDSGEYRPFTRQNYRSSSGSRYNGFSRPYRGNYNYNNRRVNFENDDSGPRPSQHFYNRTFMQSNSHRPFNWRPYNQRSRNSSFPLNSPNSQRDESSQALHSENLPQSTFESIEETVNPSQPDNVDNLAPPPSATLPLLSPPQTMPPMVHGRYLQQPNWAVIPSQGYGHAFQTPSGPVLQGPIYPFAPAVPTSPTVHPVQTNRGVFYYYNYSPAYQPLPFFPQPGASVGGESSWQNQQTMVPAGSMVVYNNSPAGGWNEFSAQSGSYGVNSRYATSFYSPPNSH